VEAGEREHRARLCHGWRAAASREPKRGDEAHV
jgi:hypothetical protein